MQPEAQQIVNDLDAFIETMKGFTADYVSQTHGQTVELQNSSGFGTSRWTADNLSLAAEDGATLRLERRRRAGSLFVRSQLMYDIAHNSAPLEPEANVYTKWELDPVRALVAVRTKGPLKRYDPRQPMIYGVSEAAFSAQCQEIRQTLDHFKQPRRITRTVK